MRPLPQLPTADRACPDAPLGPDTPPADPPVPDFDAARWPILARHWRQAA
jgi:hypothetical protein